MLTEVAGGLLLRTPCSLPLYDSAVGLNILEILQVPIMISQSAPQAIWLQSQL